MPHYAVLQPDGRMAVFSTIVDAITRYNLSDEQAIAEIERWHTGDVASHVADTRAGNLLPHQMDWTEALTWHLHRHNLDDPDLRSTALIAMTPTDQRAAIAYQLHRMANDLIAQNEAWHDAETAAALAAEINAATDVVLLALENTKAGE